MTSTSRIVFCLFFATATLLLGTAGFHHYTQGESAAGGLLALAGIPLLTLAIYNLRIFHVWHVRHALRG